MSPKRTILCFITVLSALTSLLSLAIAVSTLTAYLTKKTNAISEEVIKCLPQFKLLGTTVLFFAMAVAFGVVATQLSQINRDGSLRRGKNDKLERGLRWSTIIGVFVPPMLSVVSAIRLCITVKQECCREKPKCKSTALLDPPTAVSTGLIIIRLSLQKFFPTHPNPPVKSLKFSPITSCLLLMSYNLSLMMSS